MNTHSNPQPIPARNWLGGMVLASLVVVVYLPVWRAGFIWDDDTFLLENSLIRASDGLYRFWFTTAAPDYFPMTSTTLWLEWRIWGNHPLGYHLVNVCLHALSSILLWRVIARLKIPGAWLAAALFAVHPVNVESVAWITERKNTLAMVFYLLTVLCYLRFEEHRDRRWYGVALAAFVLALLSKTAVVTLPFVLLGIAWWRKDRIERNDMLQALPFFAIAVVMGLVTLWFQTHRAIGAEADMVRADSFGARVAGAGWAVWFYLFKALFPWNLSFVYPRWEIDASHVLSYVPGLLVLVGLGAAWFGRKRCGKGWLVALAYFVLLLLPILGFLNIYFMRYSLVTDHWQYFALIAPVTLLAAGASRWLKFQSTPIRAGLICVIAISLLGTLTWRQTRIYRDLDSLWADTLKKNPNCWLAHNNLGNALLQQGNTTDAIAHHRQALEIEPNNPASCHNLGNALLRAGQFDEAMALYQRAVQIKPGDARTHTSIGNALLQSGNVDEAIAHFEQALQIKSNYEVAHNNLGNALLAKQDVAKAIDHLQEALRLKPDYAEAENNLGNAFLRAGGPDDAMVHYQKARELRPDNPRPHNNLGNALLEIGRPDRAIPCFQTALELKPDYADARYNLGNAFLQMGRVDEAIGHYQNVLSLHPGYLPATRNLGYALLQKGNEMGAIDCFRRILQSQPDYPEVQNNLAWILATSSQASLRDGGKALELAERANQLTGGENPVVLHTLAAAYAELGRFTNALPTATKAMELAKAAGQQEMVEQLHAELKLYEAERPFRQEAQ
jgi:protein O-mannosyl-transferase